MSGDERNEIGEQLCGIKSTLDSVLTEVRSALKRLNLSEGDRVATVERIITLEQMHADLTAQVVGLREKVDLLSIAFAEHVEP